MIATVDKSDGLGSDMSDFDYTQFKFEKILTNNASRKTVFILGKCHEKPAIVILEKQAFTEKEFTSEEENENFLKNSVLETTFKNDIYENAVCWADARVNRKFFNYLSLTLHL